jgi:uncharacterized protein YcnI
MPIRNLAAAASAATLAMLASATAFAHITLETGETLADSYHKTVFRLPHGCEGSPTTGIRIRIPNGVTSVKPQPKPGWELTINKETLAQPINGPHGNRITEVVTEVSWRGGPLPDAYYDEFALHLRLPATQSKTTLYFPTVQECEQGVHRWIEIPEAGKSIGDYKSPAPALRLLPKP